MGRKEGLASAPKAGRVVSDADCGAVGTGFESRRTYVCKCIGSLRHGGILNRWRAASPLVWLVEGKERWETPDPSPGCSLSKLG
ncbi:hypothetical protein TNCV_22281 [Trichonephila clavipes]|nr:hypothetical protein TNCV_22281 [Trichonephila clavipes]